MNKIMKVEISSTTYKRATELFEVYPWLANYGFEFDEATRNDHYPLATIEIGSLDDIFKLMADCGEYVVVKESFMSGIDYDIEIYDGYRE